MSAIPTLPLLLTPHLRTLCIEPTNACNLSCVTCPVHTRKVGFMSIDLYRNILSEGLELKPDILYLSYQGESFLHPQIDQFLKLGYTSGIKNRMLFTNGMLIEPYLAVIAECLTKITFSLDGFGEVNDKIRLGCNYEAVLGNIEKLILTRQKLGSELKIGVNITRYTQTKKEISDFVKTMLKIADTVTVTDYHDKNNRYPNKSNRRTARYCSFPLNSIAYLWDGSVSFCLLGAADIPIINNGQHQTVNQLWGSKMWKEIRSDSFKLGHPPFQGCVKCERGRHNRIQTYQGNR